jgi:hypothetical protein
MRPLVISKNRQLSIDILSSVVLYCGKVNAKSNDAVSRLYGEAMAYRSL